MARLIILRGARHSEVEIRKDRTAIGYLADNDVAIADDPEVSKSHAVIERERPGRYRVRDLGSLNGTYLNETPVLEGEPRRLRSGDKLRVGQTAMFFLHTAEDEDGGVPSRRSSSRRSAMPASDGAPAAGASANQKLGKLLVLLEINKALNSETDLSRLLELIMDAAIHLTNAERGFLVLVSGGELRFMVARNVDYSVVHQPDFQVSNSIIRRVVSTGEPVLTSNAQDDLQDVQSVVDLELLSLLCVPLRVKNRILGTLYLDSRGERSRFTESDRDLLVHFSDQAAIAIENARLLREAMETERLHEELRIASMIQGSLLPRRNPDVPGLDVAGHMVTAKEVGGDYFDFIEAPNGEGPSALYACIGDVSGKGVPAGLIMVMARSVLRPLVAHSASTREVMVEVNRILTGDLRDGLFMSLLLARWDPRRQTLRYTVAGHERPIVYRRATGQAELLEGGGIVIGVMEDIGSVLAECEVTLGPGDAAVFYTDGATEAVGPGGGMFGVERLVEAVAAAGAGDARSIVDALFAAIDRFTGREELRDDVTALVIKRPGA